MELGRATGIVLQVLGWQRVDNGGRSQTRKESEERDAHCDQVGNVKTRS